MSGHSAIRRALPDLARLPIVFDLGGVSLAEGLRAALSTAALVAASAWLHMPGLIISAIAALFTCLCDIGGPIHKRVPALLSYAALGAVLLMAGAVARAAGVGAALPFAVAVIFCGAFARVFGAQSQQVGMFLGVLAVLSVDHPATSPGEVLELGLLFLGGGLWAALLTMVLWRLHPFQASRRTLARAYVALAAMTRDLQALLQRGETDLPAWEFHARAHRGFVRTAIETARTTILDTVRARGPMSSRASQSLLRLEIADQLFGAMIALSDLLETAGPGDRAAAAHMIRRLRPLLVVLGHEIDTGDAGGHTQIGRSIDAMARDIAVLPEGNPLRDLVSVIVVRLKVMLTVAVTADVPMNSGPGAASPRFWQAVRTPILANLSFRSMILRHALRAAVTTAPALAYTLIHDGPFDHWLGITIVVTMQPYFGNTFARALERVAGTTVGGLIAAGLGLFVVQPLEIAVAIIPLGLLAFALRAVSFGLFISFLTPMIVLLVEIGLPGTNDLTIAGQRVLLTLAGGISAVAGCTFLWPSWEPNRLPAEVLAAIAAHGRFADAEMALILGEGDAAAVERARRAAGLATNNVEASVARALLEPRSAESGRLEAAMVIDAALRRMAGRLAAMQFDPAQEQALSHDDWQTWRRWLATSMDALAEADTQLTPHPELGDTPHTEALGRIARQVELIAGTIARVRG